MGRRKKKKKKKKKKGKIKIGNSSAEKQQGCEMTLIHKQPILHLKKKKKKKKKNEKKMQYYPWRCLSNYGPLADLLQVIITF